jgi:phosphopantetheinyl transferase (holo-ACP synthase)
MSSISSVLSPYLNTLRSELGLPDLRIELNAAWSSQESGHREKIRSFIFAEIESNKELLNLKKPPVLSKGCVSISHNKKMGGIAFSESATALGFDIEEDIRLNPENLARFSSAPERASCPFASALWTGKEAVFKALAGPEQPSVVGQIQLGEWKELAPEVYSFRVLTVQEQPISAAASGVVARVSILGAPLTLALVSFSSSNREEIVDAMAVNR